MLGRSQVGNRTFGDRKLDSGMRDAPKAFGGGMKAQASPYSLLSTLYSLLPTPVTNRRVEQSYYTEFHRVLIRRSTEF